jgi:lycopene beta-cyclase
MTYLQFHLVFLLPPIVLLVWLARSDARRRVLPAGEDPRVHRASLAVLALLALVYTTPWDNYLVYRGVWGYPPGRVLFTIGYVPIEEYLFFVLQTLLTGLVLLASSRRLPPPAAEPLGPTAAKAARIVGSAAFLALTAAGFLLLRSESGLYLGLILAWAAPVAAVQWAAGAPELVRHARLVGTAIAVPTVYLWLADRAALELGIWWISPNFTTGIAPLGLPLEEATFFLFTNVIVVQGLTLFVLLGPRLRGRWATLRAGGAGS